MPRKRTVKDLHDSKSAKDCSCGCCKWHSSKAVSIVLSVMFILIVVAFAASLVFTPGTYYSNSILAFMGVVFLIVFIGWGFGFFCSCRGLHWHRHGFGIAESTDAVLKRRYTKGEITKKEYDRMRKDVSS